MKLVHIDVFRKHIYEAIIKKWNLNTRYLAWSRRFIPKLFVWHSSRDIFKGYWGLNCWCEKKQQSHLSRLWKCSTEVGAGVLSPQIHNQYLQPQAVVFTIIHFPINCSLLGIHPNKLTTSPNAVVLAMDLFLSGQASKHKWESSYNQFKTTNGHQHCNYQRKTFKFTPENWFSAQIYAI